MQEFAAIVADLRTGQKELRAAIASLQDRMDRRFEQIDRRFEQVDARFAHMDQRFMWLVGLQFATLLAVVAALAGAYYR